MLPNFIVIGAVRSGTASLWEYLRPHPQIFMPKQKELDYFIEELNWNRGRSWYEAWFEEGRGAHAIGEASPQYTFDPVYPGVPERMARVVGDARLIYLIRHPLQRIRSHYLFWWVIGLETEPIEEAIFRKEAYVAASKYGHQVEGFLQHFSREQLLILRSEDLLHQRQETLRRVYRFLDVDEWTSPIHQREFNSWRDQPATRPVHRRIRRSDVYRRAKAAIPAPLRRVISRTLRRPIREQQGRLPEQLETHLRDILREDVRLLRRYLGDGFDGWGIA